MSTDRDTTRIVRSWLRSDENDSADRVLGAVLDRLDATPQRRSTTARRQSPMHPILKFGLAAAVVALAVFLGINYLSAPTLNVGGNDARASTTPSTPEPTATPIPMIPSGAIPEGGQYRANAYIPVEVLVSIPAGWSGGGDWLLYGPRGPEAPDGMNIRFGSVRNLYADPLAAADGFLDPAVGPTVDDLIDAMLGHPGWDTTGPTDVTIDGYAGKAVRLAIPEELELPGGRFLLYQDEDGGDRWAWEPGQFADIYVIDVDGERLVLELFSYPGTSPAHLAERETVLASIQLRRQ